MLKRFRSTLPLLAAFALAAGASAAGADVTIESRLTIESMGGGGSGPVTVELSGLKRREERRLVFSGPFAPANPETTESAITRLDRAVLYRLDPADSSYDEVPLARVGALMRKGGAGVPPGVDPASSLDITWTVETAAPGGSETIAGHVATPSVITLRGKGKSRQTGQPIELALVSEVWTAPGVPGAAELRAFDTRYATAVGMAPGALEETLASFGLSKAALHMLTAARAKVRGTPLRTVMRLEMPGLSDMLAKLQASMPGASGDLPPVEGPLVTSTIEVTSITAGRIAPERFRVPAGFRRKLAPAGS